MRQTIVNLLSKQELTTNQIKDKTSLSYQELFPLLWDLSEKGEIQRFSDNNGAFRYRRVKKCRSPISILGRWLSHSVF